MYTAARQSPSRKKRAPGAAISAPQDLSSVAHCASHPSECSPGPAKGSQVRGEESATKAGEWMRWPLLQKEKLQAYSITRRHATVPYPYPYLPQRSYLLVRPSLTQTNNPPPSHHTIQFSRVPPSSRGLLEPQSPLARRRNPQLRKPSFRQPLPGLNALEHPTRTPPKIRQPCT